MPYQLDDGRLDRWSPDREKVWTTRWGMLRAALPDEKQQHSMLYAGSTEWRDYAIEFDVCGMRGVDKGVVVRVDGETGIALGRVGASPKRRMALSRTILSTTSWGRWPMVRSAYALLLGQVVSWWG